MEKKNSSLWYIGHGGLWVGPLTREEVLSKLDERLISWADFAWSPIQGSKWSRLCEIPLFRAFMPISPPKELIREIQIQIANAGSAKLTGPSAPPPRSMTKKKALWFLQYESSQFGPMTIQEVRAIISSGKLKGRLQARSDTNPHWAAIEDLQELQEFTAAAGEKKKERFIEIEEKQEERRTGKRVPFVATVHFSKGEFAGTEALDRTGICRDISVGGMLVFSNQVPGSVGSIIQLEVQPVDGAGLAPFHSKAKIVGILADKTGFSVRFVEMAVDIKAMLKKFLAGMEKAS